MEENPFAIFFVILTPYRFTTNECTHKEDYSYNSGLHIAFDKDNETQFFFLLVLSVIHLDELSTLLSSFLVIWSRYFFKK